MQMERAWIPGPMLLTEPVVISRAHTAGSLHDELADARGAADLLQALAGLERGTLVAVAQPAEGVTYAAKIEKSEGRDRLERTGALSIERQVRAFNPWPIAQTTAGRGAAAYLLGPCGR